MDWENKFYSIVKETEDNLEKAKKKLCGKSSAVSSDLAFGIPAGKNYHSNQTPREFLPISLADISDINMSGDYNVQILDLQDQLNHQNRTIEKLQKLIISLNSERDFFKEQLSQVKGEMDHLTERLSGQPAAVNTERQILAMKRELMREIDNIKAMLKNHIQETINSKRTSLSPSWNDDFWTVKENLTESIEQVHQELKAINSRLGRLESQAVTETCDGARPVPLTKNVYSSQYQLPKVLYTPVYKSTEDVNSQELQQLKQTVNSLNSKLDSVERRLELAQVQQSPVYAHHRTGHYRQSVIPTSHTASALHSKDDDLPSCSDLSDVSSLSDINSDDDIDILTSELWDGTTSQRQTKNKRSKFKAGRGTTGKPLVRLSDSDEDDLETDSLDLEN